MPWRKKPNGTDASEKRNHHHHRVSDVKNKQNREMMFPHIYAYKYIYIAMSSVDAKRAEDDMMKNSI